MPRVARLEVPGVPMHITHRGVNRAAVFIDDLDRRTYLELLSASLQRQGVGLHAYVLMGNHVHLLVSASVTGATSRAMRNATQCYVQWFNRSHQRTGTLWEGRFKSCLVDSERYVLTVIRYIELNPVRALMVAEPSDFSWSSVRFHLGLQREPRLTMHPTVEALACDRASRAEIYRRWLMQPLSEDELASIRRHTSQQRALGDPRFQSMIARTLNRSVVCRERGRPSRDAT
jgi:putative transposase